MTKTKGYCSLTVLSALLAACGGDKNADQSVATPSDTTSAAPAAAAAAPQAASTDTIDGTKLAGLAGDAARGEKIFVQCKACHTLEAGKNMIGPSLSGIIGHPAGRVSGFAYSIANKTSGITWTPDKLFQYLERPSRVVRGTKMSFAGLPKAQDRADVIAYVQTASK